MISHIFNHEILSSNDKIHRLTIFLGRIKMIFIVHIICITKKKNNISS